MCGVENLADVQKLEYRGGEWLGGFVVPSKSKGRQMIDKHLYSLHFQVATYQRDRCNMCLDWSSDLADVSVGSYWGEGKGRCTMLVRTSLGAKLVQSAEEVGAAKTEPLSPAHVVASYGHEVKRHGHAFRLMRRQRFGWPTPNYHRRFSFTPIRKELWLCPETK